MAYLSSPEECLYTLFIQFKSLQRWYDKGVKPFKVILILKTMHHSGGNIYLLALFNALEVVIKLQMTGCQIKVAN